MKKMLMCAALAVGAFKADAALFVNNNIGCDVALEVYAHNAAVATCGYYVWFKVPAGTSQAYNNIAALNTNVWRDASIGPSGYLPNLPAAGGVWDAASLLQYPATPQVSGPGSCGLSTLATGTLSGCTYTLTWTNLGGGNVLVDINP